MQLKEITNITLNDIIEISDMMHDIEAVENFTPEYLTLLMLNKKVTLLKGYNKKKLVAFLLLGGTHIYAIHAREQMDKFRDLGIAFFKGKGLDKLTWYSKLPEKIIMSLIPNVNKIYTVYEVKL